MDEDFHYKLLFIEWIGILRQAVDVAIESGKSLDQIAVRAGMTTKALKYRLNGKVKDISLRDIAAILNATEHAMEARTKAYPRKY